MALTDAQLQTLATDIENNTDQAVIDALAAQDANAITQWYNTTSDPAFYILLDEVEVDVAVEQLDWATDYTEFKDDIQAFLLLFRNGTYRTRGPGARAALNEILSGATSSKTSLLGAITRTATYAEKLFASTATGPGGGDGSAAGQSANTTVSGKIGRADVISAMKLI